MQIISIEQILCGEGTELLKTDRENIFINTGSRIFYIHDNIDNTTMSKICYNLLDILNNDDEKEKKEKNFKREPIKIYVNSRGGCVDDMWTLVDIMLSSKTPIYTYSTGYAHSCGFMIFVAGEKRFITKHTSMIYHQFSGEIYGTYQYMKEQITDLDRMWRDFEEYICSRTNISRVKLGEVRERKLDWVIYSEESIRLGVATDIIEVF